MREDAHALRLAIGDKVEDHLLVDECDLVNNVVAAALELEEAALG